MAPHSSVVAWRLPGTGEPGGCLLWGHTESDTTEATQQQQQQPQQRQGGWRDGFVEHRGFLGSEITLYDTIMMDTINKWAKIVQVTSPKKISDYQ